MFYVRTYLREEQVFSPASYKPRKAGQKTLRLLATLGPDWWSHCFSLESRLQPRHFRGHRQSNGWLPTGLSCSALCLEDGDLSPTLLISNTDTEIGNWGEGEGGWAGRHVSSLLILRHSWLETPDLLPPFQTAEMPELTGVMPSCISSMITGPDSGLELWGKAWVSSSSSSLSG